jgi:tryptophan halogenase
MVGQGIEAKAYHPAADILADEETLSRLAHIREVIAQTASLMPMQRDYLQRQGSASNLVLHAP